MSARCPRRDSGRRVHDEDVRRSPAGTGASVGALSHVRTNLPEFTVSSGNPAKPILPRDKEWLLKNEAEMLKRDAERRE